MRHLLALLFLFGPLPLWAAEMHIGLAMCDITPPIGMRMADNYYDHISTGVHDPLHAKAIYLQQGKTEFVLVVCDLTGIPRFFSDTTRKAIEKQLGIPFMHSVIAATHTHGAPLFYDARRDFLHEQAIQRDGKDKHEPIDYPKRLQERILEAVEKAKKTAIPARLRNGIAKQEGVAFNRRYHMKNGIVRFNPGKKNPDIVRPAGPTDTDYHLLLIEDAKTKEPFGSVSLFAMHTAVFGGDSFGADFPMHLQGHLQNKFGKTFISLFGEGCAGDINHVDVNSDRPQTPQQEPARIGKILAETFLKTEPAMKQADQPGLKIESAIVHVPMYDISPEMIERAKQIVYHPNYASFDFLLLVDMNRILDVRDAQKYFGSNKWPMQVQVVRLDTETAFVCLPHEIFVEIGMAIKKASPFQNTFVFSLCNDVDFYVPTKKAYAEGSYEIVTSRVKPGSGEQLIDQAVKLLEKVKTH